MTSEGQNVDHTVDQNDHQERADAAGEPGVGAEVTSEVEGKSQGEELDKQEQPGGTESSSVLSYSREEEADKPRGNENDQTSGVTTDSTAGEQHEGKLATAPSRGHDEIERRSDSLDQVAFHIAGHTSASHSDPLGSESQETSTPSVETDMHLQVTGHEAPSSPAAGLAAPVHRPSHTSSISSDTPSTSTSSSTPTIIHAVVLVGFNHSLGPVVEYSHPPHIKEDPDIIKNLPFLALPDGAHTRDEDYSCFHLYLPHISPSTVYGISCIRQLRAEQLLVKSPDITRSTVQKAVVVLANKPIFGPIRDKLGVITRALFDQKDFSDTQILEHFHTSLENALKDEDQTSEQAIYMSMSLREFVWKFRLQTLTLFKLLLLQRKVMLWGTSVERLCAFQYSLISLVPLLLLHLEDAASPELDSRSCTTAKPSSLKTSDRKSLLSYIGLPLHLFGKGAFFQPYLPLQQIDLLQSRSYLVGITNSIIQSQKDCKIDVIVNIDTAQIDFVDQKVAGLVHLTAADRKWMDDIIREVESTWNPSDPHRPTGMGFRGSDDWLRSKFEEYICSALAAIKFVDFVAKGKDSNVLVNSSDPIGLSSFNESWMAAFRRTPAFEVWDEHTDPVIFDLVEPRHPCEGQAHLLEDVGIRLANGLHDLHLDEKLAPTGEAISKGIATGSDSVWKVYSSIRSDIAKRQQEYRDRKQKEQEEREKLPADERAKREAEAAEQQLVSTQVLAGAADVGNKAAALASNFGSFLGSKLAKQRTQLFATAPPPEPTLQEPPRKRSLVGSSRESDMDDERRSIGSETVSRPPARGSFFSSFRRTSNNAEVTPEDETVYVKDLDAERAGTPSLAPLNLPPPSAGFTGFFRRSSNSNSPSAAPSPSTSVAVRTPTSAPTTSIRTAVHDSTVLLSPNKRSLESTGEADLATTQLTKVDSQDPLGARGISRTSLSMDADRSDVDAMSDVKL